MLFRSSYEDAKQEPELNDTQPILVLSQNENKSNKVDKISKEESKLKARNETKEEINKEEIKKHAGILEKKDTTTKPIKTSKRGRKSKIQFDPRQYDNEYITLWEDIVEGEKVLVDNTGNIYTFDIEKPIYIGKKDVTKKLNIKQILDNLKHK